MDTQIKVLFLCTGNACRSQMAEALLRHLGGDRFLAMSAGSHPAGYVHPLATAAMDAMGVDMDGQSSKSWDEFEGQPVDVVITLCDSAASIPCPVWPGAPLGAHWSHPDPVALMADEDARLDAAHQVAASIRAKIERLVAMDFAKMARDELQRQLHAIGQSSG